MRPLDMPETPPGDIAKNDPREEWRSRTYSHTVGTPVESWLDEIALLIECCRAELQAHSDTAPSNTTTTKATS